MTATMRTPCLVLLAGLLPVTSQAAGPGDRLYATGGVTQIEGAAGGGLTPWAVIAGYGTRDQIGVTAFFTRADPTDFDLQATGVAVGMYDRVEISYARQELGLGNTVPGQTIAMDTVGLKVRVIGDAVYDQDRWLPQIAVGAQYKHNLDMAVPTLLGAKDGSGVDWYVAATKVWLGGFFGRNLLLNGTLRATRANQLGLLGFGGDRNDDYRYMPEVSVAVLLTDRLAIGAEYRVKPDNLGAFPEDDFKDLFLAWFPCKRVSFTAAYVQLGQVADKRDQDAIYFSAQINF